MEHSDSEEGERRRYDSDIDGSGDDDQSSSSSGEVEILNNGGGGEVDIIATMPRNAVVPASFANPEFIKPEHGRKMFRAITDLMEEHNARVRKTIGKRVARHGTALLREFFNDGDMQQHVSVLKNAANAAKRLYDNSDFRKLLHGRVMESADKLYSSDRAAVEKEIGDAFLGNFDSIVDNLLRPPPAVPATSRVQRAPTPAQIKRHIRRLAAKDSPEEERRPATASAVSSRPRPAPADIEREMQEMSARASAASGNSSSRPLSAEYLHEIDTTVAELIHRIADENAKDYGNYLRHKKHVAKAPIFGSPVGPVQLPSPSLGKNAFQGSRSGVPAFLKKLYDEIRSQYTHATPEVQNAVQKSIDEDLKRRVEDFHRDSQYKRNAAHIPDNGDTAADAITDGPPLPTAHRAQNILATLKVGSDQAADVSAYIDLIRGNEQSSALDDVDIRTHDLFELEDRQVLARIRQFVRSASDIIEARGGGGGGGGRGRKRRKKLVDEVNARRREGDSP